jgi:hypothetical protein
MGCRRIIDEIQRYWNIKGWGHFVVCFRPNFFYFLRFAWHHFGRKVVPLWFRS